MQAADNVNFRGAFANALRRALVHFFEGEGVSAGGSGIAAESAELAMGHTNVRGIDVAVDVVISDVAVALFADVIGQPADGEQIGRFVESDAVVEGQALAGEGLCRRWVSRLHR